MYLKIIFCCTILFTLCSAQQSKAIATFNDVNKLKDDKNVLIIDVRDPSLLKKFGKIPGSINIPLGQLKEMLKYFPENEFEKTYGIKKPTYDYPLIFTCQSGGESQVAQDTAIELGYKNTRNYPGGWVDWVYHTHNGSS